MWWKRIFWYDSISCLSLILADVLDIYDWLLHPSPCVLEAYSVVHSPEGFGANLPLVFHDVQGGCQIQKQHQPTNYLAVSSLPCHGLSVFMFPWNLLHRLIRLTFGGYQRITLPSSYSSSAWYVYSFCVYRIQRLPVRSFTSAFLRLSICFSWLH